MYTRSEIRHACYRAKNNAATEKNLEILKHVEPLLQTHHRWDNFAEVWDVIIGKGGVIKIVYPETNSDYIHSTLLKAQLYVEMGKNFEDLDDRAFSLVNQVEQLMLDGVMTWENYNKVWGIEVDSQYKALKTVLYNTKSSQIEVTEEMIEASKKDADGSAFGAAQASNVLEAKPMEDHLQKMFEEFLAKKYKG